MEGTAIARRQDVEAALLTDAELPELEPEDAGEIAKGIVERILTAGTVDDVLDQGKTTPAKDVLDIPMLVRSVRWNRSALEGEGPSIYALLEVTLLDDGSEAVVTCGSRNVMAQLYRLATLGALDTPVMIKESTKPSASGRRPMWLVRAEAPKKGK
jgi:hypothetical protein